jgi:nucleoside-diphosphate-sugar epimerase
VILNTDVRELGVDWNGREVLVTCGASLIGSHLVDALVARGARVRVVDDLSSGRLENPTHHLTHGRVEFGNANLNAPGLADKVVDGMSVVFLLAADRGGRGAEDAVLRGATRLLAEKRPLVFLSTHGPQVHAECCELLTKLGYTLRPIDGSSSEVSPEFLAQG